MRVKEKFIVSFLAHKAQFDNICPITRSVV